MNPTPIIENILNDRLIKSEKVELNTLLFHSKNPKYHPESQKSALSGVMQELGIVSRIKINLRSSAEWGEDQGIPVVVDGHARISVLIDDGITHAMADFYDFSQKEEATLLLTLDPIGRMFVDNPNAIDELEKLIDPSNDLLKVFFEDRQVELTDRFGDMEEVDLDEFFEDTDEEYGVETYTIKITFDDEIEYLEVLQALTEVHKNHRLAMRELLLGEGEQDE